MFIFFFKEIVLLLGFCVFAYSSNGSLETDSSSNKDFLLAEVVSQAPETQAKPSTKLVQTSESKAIEGKIDPSLNKGEPQARGLVLAFKSWPEGKEKTALLEKLQKAGLKKKSEYEMFKTWVFHWSDWRKVEEAEKLCKEFSSLSFLDYCEPEYFLEPATGYLRKKVGDKIHREVSKHPAAGPPTPPTGGAKLNPPPIPSDPNKRGNIKSCNIVASQFNLHNGQLGDYWAQERVGADLLKEELKKAPPIKKHLVAVFDTRYKWRHDMGVRNIVSGSGPQAALPPLGNNMTYSDTLIPSHYLDNARHYTRKANKICEDKNPNPVRRQIPEGRDDYDYYSDRPTSERDVGQGGR